MIETLLAAAAISSTKLRWDALPPLWVVVLVILPAVALTVRFVYRREPGAQGRKLRMALGGLRILAVLLVLGALFGPYAETIEGEVAKRTLVIAIDTSRSMSLSDRYQRNEKLADAIARTIGTDRGRIARLSRLEIAKRIVAGDEEFLAQLHETFDLQVFTFDRQAATAFLPEDQESSAEMLVRLRKALQSAKATGGVTRIGNAIQTLVRRPSPFHRRMRPRFQRPRDRYSRWRSRNRIRSQKESVPSRARRSRRCTTTDPEKLRSEGRLPDPGP